LVVPYYLGISLLAGVGTAWGAGSLGWNSAPGNALTLGVLVGSLIFTSLCWFRLARGVVSIASAFWNVDEFKADGFSFLRSGSLVNQLRESVGEHIAGDAQADTAKDQRVQDLRMKVRLAERQKRNTEAIIYGISDAVIVIDESDRILMANEAAGQLFEFNFIEAKHRSVEEVITGENSDFSTFMVGCRKSKGRATRQEMEFVRDGSTGTYDCIVSCVYDEQEKVCGVVAVLHDITREKEISQMKNDFVSHVSHELKTPLASITAYSEMLVDGEADTEETRKEFYSVIQNQAQRLNRLIEDILNVSRIESGLIKVQKQPMSMTILIEEQLQMIKGFAEEKGIDVVGQEPIVFDQANVDKDMMSQVIVNLLSNAVKYTPSGGLVRISTEVDEISKTVCVRVTDTGVGIPADEVEHVFDKFYRVGVNKKQAKGTGLGLNLVKQIVEKVHNGRVFVKSKCGEGSTFGFELPLATAESVEVG
jgi:two-component system phosphate regulon sensor histidine kinase PhoR